MRRRNLVVWRQSGLYDGPRPVRARRIRRRVRIVALLALVAFWPVARAVRARWGPLLAGTVLTAVGVVLRGRPVDSAVLLPGLMLLLSAPLLPGTSGPASARRLKLERELAGYSTARQRFDLEATLDRYPDGVTYELRDILARQATATVRPRIPGCGRG